MTSDQFNIRIEREIREKLKNIAEAEREKTGYKVSLSDIVRRALLEFIENYKINE